jgi:hypothetical protein
MHSGTEMAAHASEPKKQYAPSNLHGSNVPTNHGSEMRHHEPLLHFLAFFVLLSSQLNSAPCRAELVLVTIFISSMYPDQEEMFKETTVHGAVVCLVVSGF